MELVYSYHGSRGPQSPITFIYDSHQLNRPVIGTCRRPFGNYSIFNFKHLRKHREISSPANYILLRRALFGSQGTGLAKTLHITKTRLEAAVLSLYK